MRNFNNRDHNHRRSDDRFSGRPSMTVVTCSDCGRDCEVPFVPTGDRPIYCSECFEKREHSGGRRFGGRGNSGGFADRYEDRDRRPRFDRHSDRSDRKTMYHAVCAACGADCEIPFRPTNDRPVYCSDCFEKQGNGKSSRPANNDTKDLLKQMQLMNDKLDRLLSALTPSEKPAETVVEDKPAKKTRKKKSEDPAPSPAPKPEPKPSPDSTPIDAAMVESVDESLNIND